VDRTLTLKTNHDVLTFSYSLYINQKINAYYYSCQSNESKQKSNKDQANFRTFFIRRDIGIHRRCVSISNNKKNAGV